MGYGKTDSMLRLIRGHERCSKRGTARSWKHTI
jgi:hypothetical protein